MWTLARKIVSPGMGLASDFFGYAVGMSGTTIVVASQKDDSVGNSGAAYVFVA